MNFKKEYNKETGKEQRNWLEGGTYDDEYVHWIHDKYFELIRKIEAGPHETFVIGLPPLKEMEGEILEALENLDIIIHADEPMIGNRFATASSIYKIFKNKIDQ